MKILSLKNITGNLDLFNFNYLQFPSNLPNYRDLKPSKNLGSVFNDCHNYIYANEGFLKDKIFHEIVKLLFMKLFDERNSQYRNLKFGITQSEYDGLLSKKTHLFEERLSELFDDVKNEYSKLFTDSKLLLQPLTLAYVVNQLQFISLENTPGDIKGEAFQTFIYRYQRGDRGEFFTPHPVVRLSVNIIGPKPGEKIIDPACGSGGFLINAIDYVESKNKPFNKSEYIRNNITGIEFNPDVALSATLRITFEGGSGSEIQCANSLTNLYDFDEKYDIVLTNPPFGSKGKVDDQHALKNYELGHKWIQKDESSWYQASNILPGETPEILFIERCIKLLKPSGRLAIVLPDGLLQNSSNSYIRNWIRSRAKILGVVSVPQEAFIPYGTGIKTSILFLQKNPSIKKHIFFAKIKKIGYDVKGQTIFKKDHVGKVLIDSNGNQIIDDDIDEIVNFYSNQSKSLRNIYLIPDEEVVDRFDAEYYDPEDKRIIDELKLSGAVPLNDICEIVSNHGFFRKNPEKEINYIAISDVDYRTMQVVSNQTMKVHEAPSRAKNVVKTNDIITAISGASTGTIKHCTALITEDENGYVCTNGFAVLRNIKLINRNYLLAYMRTQIFLRQIKRLMTGHAIPSVSIEDLGKILVPIPTEEDQMIISKSVSCLQGLRRESLKKGIEITLKTEKLISEMLEKIII